VFIGSIYHHAGDKKEYGSRENGMAKDVVAKKKVTGVL